MGRLEIWKPKKVSEYDDSVSDQEEEKSIPLFDNTGDKIQTKAANLINDVLQTSRVESDGPDDKNYFESDYSELEDESSTDDGEYAAEWNKLQLVRAVGNQASYSIYSADVVPRVWHSVFYISTIHNLENVAQKYFYSITIGHISGSASSQGIKKTVMYTPSYTLKPGERITLKLPIFIWKKRRLVLPYSELKNYIIEIEMWKTHKLQLNTLYASQTITFREVIESKSNFTITLNLNVGHNGQNPDEVSGLDNNVITQESEKRVPVHKLNVVMLLEEIFDFVFVFENWWFTEATTLPKTFINSPKTLKISVQTGTGKGWITKTTQSSYDNYWSSPGTFTFRGTLRQMKISYFVVKVYAVNNNKIWNKAQLLIGTCVMSLKSVKEYPLVRGIVKKLAIGTKNMQSGTVQGNIRCCVKSASVQFFEDLKTRPAQPVSGSALLTHLDHKGQYLVIRILRCENLPSTNSDSNTSDPMVKVKWDGIVNCTCMLESTTSPVYNQNMYFPIHLVDPKELSDPALIKYSLPIDLASKGPVIMEVWDHDDTSSEFLGGVEIYLSKLYTDGILQSRSLVDGIFNEASQKSYSQDYDGGTNNAEIAYYSEFSNGVHIPYITRMYADTVPLSGFTVPHSGSKPSITFEMYILPPMPNDLYISDGQKKAVKSDVYHDLSRRWNKDFEIWQRIYNDRLPRSITKRRFLCVTTNSAATRDKLPSEVVPLCYFVSPIQMSSQLSPPGELLHWISNFTVREEGIVKFCGFEHIETWQQPSRLLMTRKGGLHDRALLLCSCLLGLGYDAYVCKGTIFNGLREHCWVMTRHADSTVSFWETGNKRIWHLPGRWMNQTPVKGSEIVNMEQFLPRIDNYIPIQPHQANKVGVNIDNRLTGLAKYELYGADYLADEKVDLNRVMDKQDEIDYDTTAISATFHNVAYSFPKKKKEVNKNSEIIQPREELMIPSKTLVLLPYSSVETIFNHKQLWGNLQNHHPSCIFYNLDVETEWRAFLKVPLDDNSVSNVQITPPPSDTICEDTSKDILNDISDMIELMRAKRGLTCTISTDQQMNEKLEAFIDLLEFRQRLDPQFDPGMPPHLLGWSNKNTRKKIIRSMTQPSRTKMTKELRETTSTSLTDSSETTHEVGNDENEDNIQADVINTPGHTRSMYEQQKGATFKVNIRKRISIQMKHDRKSRYKIRVSRRVPSKKEMKRIKNAAASYFQINVDYNHRNPHRDVEESETPVSDLSSNTVDAMKRPWNHPYVEYPSTLKHTFHALEPPDSTIEKPSKLSERIAIAYRRSRERFVSGKNIMTTKKAGSRILSLIRRKKNKVPDNYSMPRFANDMQDILPPGKHRNAFYPEYRIPYEFRVYEQKQFSLWNWYYQLEAIQYGWQKKSGYLPIPPNHTFVGIPIHFSTSDVNEIRNLLTSTKRFKRLIVNDVDKPIYVTYVKVFPLLGGILSTWIFIGCHVPWKM